jgi:hypothetical protein
MSVEGSAIDLAELLGGAAALLVLAAGVRDRYRRTLGRRRDRYERLARLGTGAQMSFFIAVLGEPPAMRRTITRDDYVECVGSEDPRFDPALAQYNSHEVHESRTFTECFFIDRDFYVQTLSDPDETVVAFSVTARHRRFRPVFEAPRRMTIGQRWRWRRTVGTSYTPLLKVRLGRTRFADIDPTDPDQFAGPHFKVHTGARKFSYSEFHSFGNPGHYQSFVLTASSAARTAPVGLPFHVIEEIGGNEWPDPATPRIEPQWDALPRTQEFRRRTVITTYTVIGRELEERNYPSTFGPQGDEVRTLP